MHWLSLLDSSTSPSFELDGSGEDILVLLRPELKKLCSRCSGLPTEAQLEQCAELGLFGLLGDTGHGHPGLAPYVYALVVRLLSEQRVDIAQWVTGANLANRLTENLGKASGDRPYFYRPRRAYGTAGCQAANAPSPVSGLKYFAGEVFQKEDAELSDTFLLIPRGTSDNVAAGASGASGCEPDMGERPVALRVGLQSAHEMLVTERIGTMATIIGQMDRAVLLMEDFISNRVIFNRRMIEFELIRTRREQTKVMLAQLEALLVWICQNRRAEAPRAEVDVAFGAFAAIAVSTIGEIVHTFGGSGLMKESGIPGIYESTLHLLASATPCRVDSERLREAMGEAPVVRECLAQISEEIDPERFDGLVRVRDRFKVVRATLVSSLGSSEAEVRREAKQAVFQCLATAALFVRPINRFMDVEPDDFKCTLEHSTKLLWARLGSWLPIRE